MAEGRCCWVQTDIGHSGWGCLHIHAEVLMVQGKGGPAKGWEPGAGCPRCHIHHGTVRTPRNLAHPNWPSGRSHGMAKVEKTEHLPCVKYFISQFVNLTMFKNWVSTCTLILDPPNTRVRLPLTYLFSLLDSSNPHLKNLGTLVPLTDHPCQDYWILMGTF